MKKLCVIALSFSLVANAAQTWQEFAKANPYSAMIVKAHILQNNENVTIQAKTEPHPVVNGEKATVAPLIKITTTVSKKQAINNPKNPLLLAASGKEFNKLFQVDNYTFCKATSPRIYVNKDELVACFTYLKPEMLEAAKQNVR